MSLAGRWSDGQEQALARFEQAGTDRRWRATPAQRGELLGLRLMAPDERTAARAAALLDRPERKPKPKRGEASPPEPDIFERGWWS